MEKQWFVVHTLTGQESKVRDGIQKRVIIEEMGEYIGDVIIPTEKVSEVKRGVRTTTTRKFFPGYVLVNIALYDGNRQLIERTWHFIKETTGVIGFVGGERPVPLPAEEVNVVLNQVEEKREKVAPKVTYEVGETIKITDGPFVNLSGTVDEIDPDRGRMKVSVAIFDRLVSVELEYWQVERT
jgi:transcription termination/antitermination protein NusG